MKERLKALIRTDKLGTIILIFSLSFSIILCSIGGVLLSNGRNRKSSSSDNSNSTKQESTANTYTVYYGKISTIYGKAGEYYDVYYTPTYSGSHTIKLDGAQISQVKTTSGGYTYYTSNSYSSAYDYTYSVTMDSYNTYVIRIYATSSSIEILAE